MSCFTVSVFHVFVLQRAFGSQMNSKLLYELWLILPKVLKEKRLLEGLCWLEIWRSNRVAHKKQILKEGNILKMVDIWISLAVGFVKLVTFTYDIITYLPFYLIEKPYYKLKISRRVKVSFQLHTCLSWKHLQHCCLCCYILCHLSCVVGCFEISIWINISCIVIYIKDADVLSAISVGHMTFW